MKSTHESSSSDGRGRATVTRRLAMNMIVNAAAIAAATTAVTASPIEQRSADAALLEMEEQIFQHNEAAEAINPELDRLGAIWRGEMKRLYEAAVVAGNVVETEDRRLEQVLAMSERTEHGRLIDLQDAQWDAADELLEKMWALPAQTPEGKRSKLLVLLGHILGEEWRHQDDHEKTSYAIMQARRLMIELVGGEPAQQLRDQFA
jgi:hypothetical protein